MLCPARRILKPGVLVLALCSTALAPAACAETATPGYNRVRLKHP
jgi:hypothetical protein